MTRLAASDFRMWKGILETNKKSIDLAVSRFQKSLSSLNAGISNEGTALAWESAGKRRRKMAPETLARQRKHDLRSMIDRCDKQILSALGHRVEFARKIGKLKMHQAAPVVDPDRERRMLIQRSEWGKSLGLPDEFIADLFAVIIKHSSRLQAENMKSSCDEKTI